MCRAQLGKLQAGLEELRAEGAAILAVSIDRPDEAARLARDLGLTFPILSDPRMDVIGRYGMTGGGMRMGDMGYVVIDRQGRIRARRIDREFGEHIGAVLDALVAAKRETS